MNAFTIWLPVPPYYSDSFNPCIPAVVYGRQNYDTSPPGFISQQPEWEFVGNIGDASPLEYGGGFVYRDKTGVYPPEVHYWLEREEDSNGNHRGKFIVYTFQCEPCFFTDGILSDNKYHKNTPAWFADKLDSIGIDEDELIDAFLSADPMLNAFAWQETGQYWGFENLDSYPERYTPAEMEERYAKELSSI